MSSLSLHAFIVSSLEGEENSGDKLKIVRFGGFESEFIRCLFSGSDYLSSSLNWTEPAKSKALFGESITNPKHKVTLHIHLKPRTFGMCPLSIY